MIYECLFCSDYKMTLKIRRNLWIYSMYIKIEVNISRSRQIYINKCIIQPNQTSKSTNRYNWYFDISTLYMI